MTETMLIAGVNDGDEHLREVAGFLGRLCPDTAYLAIPTRPPAEGWVRAPGEETLNRAYQILSEKVRRVEYLIGYEGDAFAFTGDVEEDLLSIMSVHPMREEAVNKFLLKSNSDWDIIEKLIEENKLIEVDYRGDKYFMRKLPTRQ